MTPEEFFERYTIPFEDRIITGRMAQYMGGLRWRTLHVIEEEDESLYFEDEDPEEAVYSIYFDEYIACPDHHMIECPYGACFRVREGQTIRDWIETNGLHQPVAEIDLDRLMEEKGLDIFDLESCDFDLIFG